MCFWLVGWFFLFLKKGQQVGVPKNVVVRFLAETSYETFDRDIAFLK